MTKHVPHSGKRDCCEPSTSSTVASNASTGRIGRLSTPIAVGVAILSSACCWLPLLLLVFGLSAGGVAGIFAAVRPYFLTGAVIFLGAGFYTAYFRRPVCKSGDTCVEPQRKVQRFNRAMLWIAFVLVVVFALFPDYSPALIRAFSGLPRTTVSSVNGTSAVLDLRIPSMDCAACAAGIQVMLQRQPGVESAQVSFATKQAVVRYDASTISAKQILSVIDRTGYEAEKTGRTVPRVLHR